MKPAVMVDGPASTAKRYCQRCTVVIECLGEAMDNPQLLGVWGGLTSRERGARRNVAIQIRRAAS